SPPTWSVTSLARSGCLRDYGRGGYWTTYEGATRVRTRGYSTTYEGATRLRTRGLLDHLRYPTTTTLPGPHVERDRPTLNTTGRCRTPPLARTPPFVRTSSPTLARTPPHPPFATDPYSPHRRRLRLGPHRRRLTSFDRRLTPFD
ncbi:uncharacterized protein SCHCODRAFT_02753467, partial [Schizophyllum commune H4-8]|uniref:uncharacterized protein n=1 Tax=Schizophyllum commune (strain H4-8 / FGSC 9210) TaxID=578458 RepID=UPI002160CA77